MGLECQQADLYYCLPELDRGSSDLNCVRNISVLSVLNRVYGLNIGLIATVRYVLCYSVKDGYFDRNGFNVDIAVCLH